MESSPNVADAALAVAQVAYDTARLPLGLAARLPGMRRLANDGAYVRVRLRSRLESVVLELLSAPELERAVDRVIAGTLPDAIVRSLLEHHVVERLAEPRVDLDAAVARRDPRPPSAWSPRSSPARADRCWCRPPTARCSGPELQRVIEHVAASPEVRARADQAEHDAWPRSWPRACAPRRDPRRRRRTHGPRMVATAAPSRLATAGIATRGIALAIDAAIANLICSCSAR